MKRQREASSWRGEGLWKAGREGAAQTQTLRWMRPIFQCGGREKLAWALVFLKGKAGEEAAAKRCEAQAII